MNGTERKCDIAQRCSMQILGIAVREIRKFGGKAFIREITEQFPKSEAHKFLFQRA